MKPLRLLKPHPAAALFPLLEGDELLALVEDIRQHGVRQPVVTYRGELLDGRNRIRACDLLGQNPPSIEYDGDSPVGFVISANLRRRHMSDSQRALVAAGLATMRQGARTDLSPIGERLSQAQAAELLNVGKRSVERASEVLDHGVPELVAAVQQGAATVSAAAVVASLPADAQRAAVADGAVAAVAKSVRTVPAGDAEIVDATGPTVRLAQRPAVAEVADVGPAAPEPAGGASEGGKLPPPQGDADRATAPPPAPRTQASRVPPDALAAASDGYDSRDAEIDNLRGAVEALTAENERLEGENAALQDAIALAKLPDGERVEVQQIIADLRNEVEALRKELATAAATLQATSASRDTLLDENAQLKRQCAAQRREIDQLGGGHHAA